MTKTILVIEDDPSVLELLRDVLTSEGFDVLAADDGEWGLRTFQSKPVDLVILDVLLPKIQGFDLISRIRLDPRGTRVPLIVISGVFREKTYKADLVRRFSIVEYLDKPLDVDGLIDVLHDVFSSAYPEPKTNQPLPPAVLSEVRRSADGAQVDPPRAQVPLRGELSEISFARLLGFLFSTRASGALLLRKSSVKKIVYLKEGIPVFVKSNLLTECLGRVMVAERLITQEECDASLEKKKRTPQRRQGAILVEMGSISQHNLEFGLELQMQTKLFDIFSWLEGSYQFNPSTTFDSPQVALSMGPTTLIHEGASRSMSTDRIRRDLAFADGMLIVPSRDPTFRYQALQLDPRCDRFLDRIDGTHSIDELVRSGDLPQPDAALLIYALLSTGLVRLIDPFRGLEPAIDEPSDPESLEDEALEEAIALDDSDVEVISTGEIDAIAQLAKARDDALAHHGVEVATLRPAPAAEEDDEAEETVAAATVPEPIPQTPPPAAVSKLPRAQTWVGKKERMPSVSEPAVAAPEPRVAAPKPREEGPALSQVRRLEVRARLEAEMAKLAESRTAVMGSGTSRPQTGTSALPSERSSSDRPRSGEGAATEVPTGRAAASEVRPSPTGPSEVARGRVSVAPGPASSRFEPSGAVLPRGARTQTDPALRPELQAIPRASEGPALKPRAKSTTRRLSARAGLRTSRAMPQIDLERERERTESELRGRLEAMTAQDDYAVLGVELQASADEIRSAYQVEARKVSPDRLLPGVASHGAHKLAERIHMRLTRALNKLTHPVARSEYDRRIGVRPDPEAAAPIRSARAFELGLASLQNGDLDAAGRAFAEAVRLDPTDGEALAHLVWARHQTASPDAVDETIDAMERAAELAPRSEKVHLYAGAILRAAGHAAAAAQAYGRALACNPDCVEALVALRALEPPAPKKTGLLSRLSLS